MKQLKKTILTLVALLALTTQAWATDVYLVGNGTGNWLNGAIWDPGVAENKMTEQNGVYSITFTNVDANSELLFKFAINGTWDVNYGCSSTTENELNKTLSNIEALGDNIMFGLTEPADVTISFNLSELTFMISTKGMKVGDDTHPVDLTRGTGEKINEWTLTNGMPAGNVTVSVDYYPQATAEGAVTAATDVKATTDAELVTIDKTKLTGVAKMMYYVSTEATAPAYDDEGWTDKVPTAEKFTEAGNVNVWYYPVGTDEGVGEATATYSDGDMNATALAVSLGAAPTYDVTLNAEGLSTDEAAAWQVAKGTDQPAAFPLKGVKKGETVTVTYSGQRKVIGVKAEKKVSTVPVTAITLNKTETSIKVGATETLSVTSVLPEEATDKTYTWKTSDESKATVDQDGKVTAVAAGTVTIYAEANDGSGVKGNCTVTVTPAVPDYYNKLTKINDDVAVQIGVLKGLGRGKQAYNSSLTAAQAYALATYQAAIDGKAVYVIMSSKNNGYEIHYAVSTDASATEHTADLYSICDMDKPAVRMYYIAQ